MVEIHRPPTARSTTFVGISLALGLVYLPVLARACEPMAFPLEGDQVARLLTALGTGGLVVLSICICLSQRVLRRPDFRVVLPVAALGVAVMVLSLAIAMQPELFY